MPPAGKKVIASDSDGIGVTKHVKEKLSISPDTKRKRGIYSEKAVSVTKHAKEILSMPPATKRVKKADLDVMGVTKHVKEKLSMPPSAKRGRKPKSFFDNDKGVTKHVKDKLSNSSASKTFKKTDSSIKMGPKTTKPSRMVTRFHSKETPIFKKSPDEKVKLKKIMKSSKSQDVSGKLSKIKFVRKKSYLKNKANHQNSPKIKAKDKISLKIKGDKKSSPSNKVIPKKRGRPSLKSKYIQPLQLDNISLSHIVSHSPSVTLSDFKLSRTLPVLSEKCNDCPIKDEKVNELEEQYKKLLEKNERTEAINRALKDILGSQHDTPVNVQCQTDSLIFCDTEENHMQKVNEIENQMQKVNEAKMNLELKSVECQSDSSLFPVKSVEVQTKSVHIIVGQNKLAELIKHLKKVNLKSEETQTENIVLTNAKKINLQKLKEAGITNEVIRTELMRRNLPRNSDVWMEFDSMTQSEEEKIKRKEIYETYCKKVKERESLQQKIHELNIKMINVEKEHHENIQETSEDFEKFKQDANRFNKNIFDEENGLTEITSNYKSVIDKLSKKYEDMQNNILPEYEKQRDEYEKESVRLLRAYVPTPPCEICANQKAEYKKWKHIKKDSLKEVDDLQKKYQKVREKKWEAGFKKESLEVEILYLKQKIHGTRASHNRHESFEMVSKQLLDEAEEHRRRHLNFLKYKNSARYDDPVFVWSDKHPVQMTPPKWFYNYNPNEYHP